MSHVSSDHPRESGKTPAASPDRSAPDKLSRPGWPEIAVGLVVLAVVGFGGGALLVLGFDPGVSGLILTAWSGVAGIAGFAAAVMLRIRSPGAFGVRATTARWLLIAAGAGVVASVARVLVTLAWIRITGDSATPQTVYAEGAGGGALSLILATAFLGLLTPLGEELLFRGVVTNVLLRYGPFIGVVGSTLIFALFHGVNIVFPTAVVSGLVAGEVFRRSGSVWPAVVVHAVVNLPGPLVMVLAGMG